MPVERSGNVATFTFNAQFTGSVPLESIDKSLEPNRPYMFNFRMIRGVKEAAHVDKEIETTNLILEISTNNKLGET